jgi:hypothetical protein
LSIQSRRSALFSGNGGTAVMTAVENPARALRSEKTHSGEIVLLGLAGATLLVAISLRSADGVAAWQLAAELTSRFSTLLFIVAMTVEPISRLVPTPTLQDFGRERGGFMLAFGLSAATSLACVAAPYVLGIATPSPPAIIYCTLTSSILAVMLLAGHPATMRMLGAPAWRAMQRIATAYFWIAFTLIGFDHVVGPHRPDHWYGYSLLLLVAAVLIRFGDTLVTHVRRLPPSSAV